MRNSASGSHISLGFPARWPTMAGIESRAIGRDGEMGVIKRNTGTWSNAATAAMIGGAVMLLALPSAVLGFSNHFDPQPQAAADDGLSTSFVPASVDPRLARSIAVRTLSRGQTFRFTPAVTPTHTDRSVTVAVRVDGSTSRALMRGAVPGRELASESTLVRIAPAAYSLGAMRGYKSFAQSLVTAQGEQRGPGSPDLSAFRPSAGVAEGPSAFTPRIALDEREKTGRSPRTLEGQGEQTVDLGGAYRLTRNLDVTAGVRYKSDRDRLGPLTNAQQDSQAVYVGTQFRF